VSVNNLRVNVADLGWADSAVTKIARLLAGNPLGGTVAWTLDFTPGWFATTPTILGDQMIPVGSSGPYTWGQIAPWVDSS